MSKVAFRRSDTQTDTDVGGHQFLPASLLLGVIPTWPPPRPAVTFLLAFSVLPHTSHRKQKARDHPSTSHSMFVCLGRLSWCLYGLLGRRKYTVNCRVFWGVLVLEFVCVLEVTTANQRALCGLNAFGDRYLRSRPLCFFGNGRSWPRTAVQVAAMGAGECGDFAELAREGLRLQEASSLALALHPSHASALSPCLLRLSSSGAAPLRRKQRRLLRERK